MFQTRGSELYLSLTGQLVASRYLRHYETARPLSPITGPRRG